MCPDKPVNDRFDTGFHIFGIEKMHHVFRIHIHHLKFHNDFLIIVDYLEYKQDVLFLFYFADRLVTLGD